MYSKLKCRKNLDSLSRWLAINKLMLNVKKTKSILFHRHNKQKVSLIVNGSAIEPVVSFKYLGFLLI